MLRSLAFIAVCVLVAIGLFFVVAVFCYMKDMIFGEGPDRDDDYGC